MSTWETVIGLECHAELHTRTKIFCGCPNNFGDEPNTNVCPVCLGLPGSLPVLNRQVVELAIRLGTAVSSTVQDSIFHRKNYFYPDMPKDYQVSQYDLPIDLGGHLDLPSGARIGITRAHLEEDTGKSSHQGGDGRIHGSSGSLVDYNRAGVPLLEIVSEPDIRSADQAREYLTELRSILEATGVSDAKMEEGSLRCDANVSVRKPGAPLGTRCEIKNLNSIRSLGRAIEAEARRQIDDVEAGETIRQETRHFDEKTGRTHTLRVKENSDDYRYFPEPDLVPLAPDQAWLDRVQAELPQLPAARRVAVAASLGASHTDATVMSLVERGLDEMFHAEVAAGGVPERIAIHLLNNLPAERSTADPGTPSGGTVVVVAPRARRHDHPKPIIVRGRIAELTRLEADGKLTATQAKAVLADIVAAGGDGDPAAIAAAKGFEAMDDSALVTAVDAAIAAHPDAWAKFVAGDEKVAGVFVGAVMKATRGKADGKAVSALLQQRRNG